MSGVKFGRRQVAVGHMSRVKAGLVVSNVTRKSCPEVVIGVQKSEYSRDDTSFQINGCVNEDFVSKTYK